MTHFTSTVQVHECTHAVIVGDFLESSISAQLTSSHLLNAVRRHYAGAERRAAPPGGNMETSRPGASRPKLLRPRASDVFMRDEPRPRALAESIVARTEERTFAADARAEHASMTSRRWFGTETFRRWDRLFAHPSAVRTKTRNKIHW
jgi:hypothetical protein